MFRDNIREVWERRWGSLNDRFLHRFLQHEGMADLESVPSTVLEESIGAHQKLRAALIHARRLMSGEELTASCDCDSVLSEHLSHRSDHELVFAEGPITRAAGGRPNTESVHGLCACGWERYGSRASVAAAHSDHVEAHHQG